MLPFISATRPTKLVLFSLYLSRCSSVADKLPRGHDKGVHIQPKRALQANRSDGYTGKQTAVILLELPAVKNWDKKELIHVYEGETLSLLGFPT